MKKFVSFILVAVMLVTFVVPAFAADINASDNIKEAKNSAEIQSEKERIFSSVYAQL